MLRLEDFGITLPRVTALIWISVACAALAAAIGILGYCLFSIGLARIAKSRGDEKEWYAYLPLLRMYTLGKSAPGGEKTKKIFACLLPTVLVTEYIMLAVTYALLANATAGLIFAAENKAGSSIALSALYKFPVSYCIAAVIIAAIIAVAAKIILAISYYGAYRSATGNTAKAAVFAVLSILCDLLGAALLFVVSREKKTPVIAQEASEAAAEE